MVSQIDFLASFSELLNVKIPENHAVDSRSTLSTFSGNDTKCLPYLIEENRTRGALRVGDWKYVIGPRKKQKDLGSELYNLKHDPGEQNNILVFNKEMGAKMDAQLKEIIESGSID